MNKIKLTKKQRVYLITKLKKTIINMNTKYTIWEDEVYKLINHIRGLK